MQIDAITNYIEIITTAILALVVMRQLITIISSFIHI